MDGRARPSDVPFFRSVLTGPGVDAASSDGRASGDFQRRGSAVGDGRIPIILKFFRGLVLDSVAGGEAGTVPLDDDELYFWVIGVAGCDAGTVRLPEALRRGLDEGELEFCPGVTVSYTTGSVIGTGVPGLGTDVGNDVVVALLERPLRPLCLSTSAYDVAPPATGSVIGTGVPGLGTDVGNDVMLALMERTLRPLCLSTSAYDNAPPAVGFALIPDPEDVDRVGEAVADESVGEDVATVPPFGNFKIGRRGRGVDEVAEDVSLSDTGQFCFFEVSTSNLKFESIFMFTMRKR